ncbi:MAG: hypothetical protein JRH20_19460 [Deltaproteobacteria bacterium]|nr:hypothetical protein [Deltaproteobacteria bacterium]
MTRLLMMLVCSMAFSVGCSSDDSSSPTATTDSGADRTVIADQMVGHEDASLPPADSGTVSYDVTVTPADSGPTGDVTVSADQSLVVDVGIQFDGSVAVTDLAMGTLNCWELYQCAQVNDCQTLACIEDCKVQGCLPSQPKAMDLRVCALANCSVECQTYGTDCQECIIAKCDTLYTACVADQC